MKLKLKEIDKRWKEYALAGCVCILFFVCLTNLGKIWSVIAGFLGIIKPLFLGFVIAYILNPLAVWFESKLFRKVKRDPLRWTFSVLLTILLSLLALGVLVALLIPQIVENVTSLASNYRFYVAHLRSFIENLNGPLAELSITDNLLEYIDAESGAISTLGNLITENARVILAKTTSIGSAAVSWLIGAIFAIYFLLAKYNIRDHAEKDLPLILSPLKFRQLKILLEKFNSIFSRYIVCTLIDAFVIGVVNCIFMAALRMPDVLFISVVVAVTNLAPTFGPIVGAAIGGFILLLIKPACVLPFLIFTVVLQTLDGYVIKPKLFGNVLNVPGVLILIAIIVFGKLMGVPGMLIAIPAAGIIVYIYSEVLIPRLELKRDLKEYRKEQGK